MGRLSEGVLLTVIWKVSGKDSTERSMNRWIS